MIFMIFEIYAGLIIKSKFGEIFHIKYTYLLILKTWQTSKLKKTLLKAIINILQRNLVILAARRGLYKLACITQNIQDGTP